MKKTLVRFTVVALLGLAVWGAWTGWKWWRIGQSRDALTEVASSETLDALIHGRPLEGDEAAQTQQGDESVDLALRGITLAHGENGLELWKLNATWATLRQKSGLVLLREPHILYPLGEPSDTRDGRPAFAEDQFVDVTSLRGRVEDNNTLVTLQDHVRAVYRGDVLTGPVAIHNSKTRTLLFPEGADLEGSRLSGHAHVLRWDLSTDILYGEKGVDMIWTPSSESDPQESGSSTAVPTR